MVAVVALHNLTILEAYDTQYDMIPDREWFHHIHSELFVYIFLTYLNTVKYNIIFCPIARDLFQSSCISMWALLLHCFMCMVNVYLCGPSSAAHTFSNFT